MLETLDILLQIFHTASQHNQVENDHRGSPCILFGKQDIENLPTLQIKIMPQTCKNLRDRRASER